MSYLLKYKIISTIVITLVCFLVLIMPMIAFGQANEGKVAEQADVNFIHDFLFLIVNSVFGTMVWYAGMLLNFAVTDYVIGFGNQFINSGLGFAVNNLWTTVRDIFNLTFIFGLVYIGFKMILDSSDSNARKMLVHIILAALLVNFSLFFTKFIVDFSNIAAAQIAQGFEVGQIGGVDRYLIADKFIDEMGVSSIWGEGKGLSALVNGEASPYTYIFGMMIIFIITAFVFFVGGILLMIRFVVLNLYMILSPIMFLGWVFPGLASYSQMWWNGFLARAFFAPAYLLMLYFAATILTEFAALNQSAGTKGIGDFLMDPAKNQEAFGNIVPYFAMMAIFLIAAVIVAQKMAGQGGEMAMSIGKSMVGGTRRALQRGAGNATFGGIGWVGQKTIGLGAHTLANSKGLNKWASESKLGEYVHKASTKVADSSLDVRQIAGLGKALGIGEGTKGGLSTRIKQQATADAAYQKSLKQNVTRDDNNELTKDAKEVVDKALSKNNKLTELNTSLKDLNADAEVFGKTITETEAKLKAERENLEAAKRDTSRSNEISKIENDIRLSEIDLQDNKYLLEKKKKEIERKESEIERKESEISTVAEADYKYANQIAFRNRREEEGKVWQSSKYLAGAGTVAGVAGGAAAIGLGVAALPVVVTAGVVAGIGSAVAKAYGVQNSQVASTIARTYGKNGSAMAKNDKAAKELKLLKDKLDEDNKTSTSKTEEAAPKPTEATNPKV